MIRARLPAEIPSLTALPVALAAVLTLALPGTLLGERLERMTQDLRLAARGPRASSAPVVVVAIDDATVQAWQDLPMALWGNHYAALARQLRRAGAGWVGFDLIPAIRAEEGLHLLIAEAFQQARGSGTMTDADLDRLLASPSMTPGTQFREAVRRARGRIVLADTAGAGSLSDELRGLTAEEYIAFANAPAQADGVIRTAALYRRTPGGIQASLPALLAARVRGADPRRAGALRGLAPGASEREGVATFWINPRRAIPRIAAWRAESAAFSPSERAALRGAAVLLGATHTDSPDWRSAPGAGRVPGVLLQAQAVATLLDCRPLRRASPWAEGAMGLGLVLLLAALLRRAGVAAGTVVCAAGAAGWSALAAAALARDLLLPVSTPLLGSAALFLGTYAARAAREARQRRQISQAFGRYVTPQIRDYLLANPRRLDLVGEEREASVLFLDLRNSTAFGRNRTPPEVLRAYNALFGRLVPAIGRHGGLLLGYRGDGFLAVFGAPMPQRGHAQAAVDAALAAIAAMPKRGAGPEADRWRIGCSIHSGPVVCGNLGTDERAEFTVLGDVVNLAAKLEPLNKELGSTLILTQETAGQLEALPAGMRRQEREVAGRTLCLYALDTESEGR